jgi:uncharacterized membrane protein
MAIDGHRIINMGNSAMPDWAMVAAPQTDHAFLTMMLTLIQLLGIIGIGKGVSQVMKYYNPNAQKPPENLSKPLLMIIFGMFALVPTRVYEMGINLTELMGWG